MANFRPMLKFNESYSKAQTQDDLESILGDLTDKIALEYKVQLFPFEKKRLVHLVANRQNPNPTTTTPYTYYTVQIKHWLSIFKKLMLRQDERTVKMRSYLVLWERIQGGKTFIR